MLPLYVSALSISLLFIWRSLQLVISLLFCVKRRLAVRIRLQRISKAYTIIRRGDVPNVRHPVFSLEIWFAQCRRVGAGSLCTST
jgi:hypothetical protein